ncbi:hypothetical protein BH11ACT8_BH11ACT8_13270 [soil metagenome]
MPERSSRRLTRHWAALVAALLLALGALSGCSGSSAAEPFSGQVLDTPYQVPDIDLTDTDGNPFSLAADTDKRLTMVFFGYTRCADGICPGVLQHLASALVRLDAAQRDQVDVVMVSTDPSHDTPQVLGDYMKTFDTSFIGLTGDISTVKEVAAGLKAGVDETDPGGHTTLIMGVDSADEAPVYWGQDTTPAQFANDIRTLLEDS